MRHYGMDFRFSSHSGNIECALHLRWPVGMNWSEEAEVRPLNWSKYYKFNIASRLFSLISSQSLNLGGRRGTTDVVATIHFHPSLSTAALREFPNPIPVYSLMLFSHLFLSSPPSCSFHCALQKCLRHARGSWDVAIPSQFPFLYHG